MKTSFIAAAVISALANLASANIAPVNNNAREENINPSILKRIDIEHYECRVPSRTTGSEWGAKEGTIKKGIKYLRGLNGKCHLPGSDKPGRISCSNNGGIWVINMHPDEHDVYIPWNEIADHAQYLVDHCAAYDNLIYRVMGTTDDKQGRFQVVVGDTAIYGESC